ncbi:hypothetical protein TNCV_3636931 [Trichonephila clavipes]|nr:hypothetical protein TNCV_3636931 [Trichonephila clavipes]
MSLKSSMNFSMAIDPSQNIPHNPDTRTRTNGSKRLADRIMKVPLLMSMPSVNSIDPIVVSASPSFGDIRIAGGEGGGSC